MGASSQDPNELVLSTMARDGSRRWLRPKLSKGAFLNRRRVVAYLLIAAYTLGPHVQIGGSPAILLDVPARRFTLFGFTFLPTDTLLLALAMMGLLLGFFLLTALLGRVWCGWACPQTVYLEFLFRPLERLLDGTSGRGGEPRRPPAPVRVALKYAVYLLLSVFVANTFLAYFVGAEQLWEWMHRPPFAHPGPFLLVTVITGAMMFNFSRFREQMCILACPYGRLQSVLLDESSLIVGYDKARGEPRGKKRKNLPVVEQPKGDCVDCGLCASTCPTGIDIRNGLQMECVGCMQCVDACNAVMKKLDRAPNLIRYSSARADADSVSGKAPRRRLRIIVYPALIAVFAALFVTVLASKQSFDAVLLRNQGHPFTTDAQGQVRNVVRLKLTNRSDAVSRYTVQVQAPNSTEIDAGGREWLVAAGAVETFPLSVFSPASLFVGSRGKVELVLRVTADNGDVRDVSYSLLGPDTLPPPANRKPK